jgi:hypothetical protein
MAYDYPLNLRFKILAIASQIYVQDAAGRDLLYVKQRAFRLREDVRIFADPTQTSELFQMRADRIIDISPRFTITDPGGGVVGGIKREGLRSIWRASYLLEDGNGIETHHIKEENPWAKVLDGLLSEVPVIGMFTNYLIHPSYLLYDSATGRPLFRLRKRPAFFEGRFSVEQLETIPDPALEARLVLGMMLMVIFERARG